MTESAHWRIQTVGNAADDGSHDSSCSSTKEGISQDNAVSIVVPDAVVYLPLEDLVDFEQEKERLTKEEERLNKEIKRAKGMLANEKFVSKAPEAKVQEERDKAREIRRRCSQQVKERMVGLNELINEKVFLQKSEI